MKAALISLKDEDPTADNYETAFFSERKNMPRPFAPSHETLAKVLKPVGRKALALDLGLSVSSIDKMCEEPRSDSNPDGSGQRNFLDEYFIAVNLLRQGDCAKGGAHDLAKWTAFVSGGFFTPNPQFTGIPEADFCGVVNAVMKDTAELIERLRTGYFSPGQPHVFTKAQRRDIHAQVDSARSSLILVDEFVRMHKAEER